MSNFGNPASPGTSRSPGSPTSPGSPESAGSPGQPRGRRRSVSPGFLRLYADRGSKSPPQVKRQRDAPKSPVGPSASLVMLIEEGDINGFEELASKLSAPERTLAFTSKIRYGSGKNRSLISVAINHGELPLLQAVIKWIPRGQAATVLMSTDDNERTPLMLAAATGNTAIFDAIASKLPPAEMLQHLNAQCAMGNSIFSYAALSGSAEMIEAAVGRFPLNQLVVSAALASVKKQVLPLLCVKNFVGETTLMHAARVPGPDAFSSIAKLLTYDQVKMQLEATTNEGHTALAIATRAGAFPTWKEVASKMTATEVNRQLLATDVYGEDAIMLSIRSGNDIMFFTVIRHLTEEQLLMQLGARNAEGRTPVQVAVICNAKTILAAMVRPSWVAACMLDATDDSEMHQTALDLAAKPPAKLDIICCLLASGATPSARTVLRLVRNCGYGDTQGHDADGHEGEPGGFAAVRECFLGAMTASEWAINPLIPGLNLSVALIEAIRQSSDFLARLRELRADVDTLLLSVLKYLPDTVAGFDRFSPATTTGENRQTKLPSPVKRVHTGLGEVQASLSSTVARGQKKNECFNESITTMGTGLTFVQEMLEPELAGLRAKKCPGPLAQAVQFRHQEFICSPLVVDYLRVKFSAGLPNPLRETNWRRESGRMDRDLARFMLDEDESTLKVYILQGGCSDSPSWTYLPGLQFILAGLVGNTAAFFAVPAMRLALDVMVYTGIMALFVVKVVVIRDAGVLTPWEFMWLIYVVGAVWQQMREVEEIGSIRTHFSNPWNVVETAALVSLITAQVFRLWAFVCHGRGEYFCGEVTDDPLGTDELNEVYLAQYFQAVSAPFVLGKVLFLTQIHSSLGPLMHSTFRMFSDLARFGALMLVFILGFALAFYALFGSTSALLPDGGEIPNYNTYFSSLLTLFSSMLGTFDFSDFSGAPMEGAGVILLVLFLCLMNVTLLNLLIAILTTTHAKVEKNADKEAVLSEALIITQYRQAMRSDSLPSPLNIPQELVSHLFWRNTERAKELFARGMFWLITGPVAIAATAVLWAMSLPLTLAWTVRVLRSYGPSMIVPSILGISFNLGIAPLMTALLWLYGVAGIWRQGDGVTETSDLNEIEVSRAHRRRSAAGVVGSPLANIALAALAQKAKGSAAIAVTDTDVSGNQPNVSDASQGRGDSASPRDKSKLWKQAAEFRRIGNITGGGTNRAVGGRNQGFHVAAALHASHGLTIQKLREALDDQSKVTDQAETFQRGEAWSDALASISKGQERLEENIREADKRRERMEAKLDNFIHAFLERDRSDSAKKSAEEQKSPISGAADSMPSSHSAHGEEPVSRASVVRGRGENRTRNSVAEKSTAQEVMDQNEDCAKDSDYEID